MGLKSFLIETRDALVREGPFFSEGASALSLNTPSGVGRESVGLVDIVVRVAQLIGGHRFVGPFIRRATLRPISLFRSDVIANIRIFQKYLLERNHVLAVESANDLCEGIARAMAALLNVDTSTINCRIEVVLPVSEGTKDLSEASVGILASSRPLPDRSRTLPLVQPKIGEDSAWASICGVGDSIVDWPSLECFVSNNLRKHANIYKSHLDDWQSYYKSILVFPIRFQGVDNNFYLIGILIFESKSENTFTGLPDIYDFDVKGDLTQYLVSLNESAAFHYGMAMAEILTGGMRAFWFSAAAEAEQLPESKRDKSAEDQLREIKPISPTKPTTAREWIKMLTTPSPLYQAAEDYLEEHDTRATAE
jgi:hypothetical protein